MMRPLAGDLPAFFGAFEGTGITSSKQGRLSAPLPKFDAMYRQSLNRGLRASEVAGPPA